METANAARAAPKVSSGSVEVLTLNAETAKKLTDIPAMAQAGVGAAGMAAVTRESSAAAKHTRNRAAAAGRPPRMMRNESHPPAKPPPMATNGGIQAYHAACRTVSEWASTKYCVVQLVQSE